MELDTKRPQVLFTTPKDVSEDCLSTAEKDYILDLKPERIMLLNPASSALDSFFKFIFQECRSDLQAVFLNLYSHGETTALRIINQYDPQNPGIKVGLDYRSPDFSIDPADRDILTGASSLVLPNLGTFALEPDSFLEGAYLAGLDYPGLMEDRNKFFCDSSSDWPNLPFSRIGRSLMDVEFGFRTEDLEQAKSMFPVKLQGFRLAMADLSVSQFLLTA